MKRRLPNYLIASFLLLAFLFSGCSRERSSELPPPTVDVSKETTSISVFYPTGKILVEERRVVEKNQNLPLAALRELFKAAPKEHEIQVVLPKATVRSVTVAKDGLAVIDFSKEILDFPEPSKEAKIAAFAAIVETLKQFENIKKFKITVEGKEKGVIDGKKIEELWGDITIKRQPIDIVRKKPETTEKTQ